MAGPAPSAGGQLIDASEQPPLMLAGFELNRTVIASHGVLVIGTSVIQSVQSARRRRQEEREENTDVFFEHFGGDELSVEDEASTDLLAEETMRPISVSNELLAEPLSTRNSGSPLPRCGGEGLGVRGQTPTISTPRRRSILKPMLGSLAGSVLLFLSLFWTNPAAVGPPQIAATSASLQTDEPQTRLRPIEEGFAGVRPCVRCSAE
ncbi:MAG: hypothetical protein ACF788_08170 [Novipirellula sp. JB048]